jgi:malonyl-CoA O-methyltransferase
MESAPELKNQAEKVESARKLLSSLELWGEKALAEEFNHWLAHNGIADRPSSEFSQSEQPTVQVEANKTCLERARAALANGNSQLAADLMHSLERAQSNQGGIPYSGLAGRLCPATTILAAAIWFRLGDWIRGESAYQAFMKVTGNGNSFADRVSDSIGTTQRAELITVFLEALHYRLRLNFERTADHFPATISADDGRYALIESLLEPNLSQVVVDLGCGKGRFIKQLKERNPRIQAWGIDISTTMLSLLPPEIATREGSLIASGLPSGTADYVFCIEALEHAVNARAGIRELSRITKDQGMVVVIDKCAKHLGTMQLCDWEQWFDEKEVTGWLQEEGFQVEVRRGINKPGTKIPDPRFLSWIARR